MELSELLRQRGGRVTQARQAVWDALVAIDGHATVQEIITAMSPAVGADGTPGHHGAHGADGTPAVNPSSVYRSLQLFDELGLVRESRTDTLGSSTWEIRHPDAHIHLVCRTCGGVSHHPTTSVDTLRDELTNADFEPTSIDVSVDGQCGHCRRVEPTSDAR